MILVILLLLSILFIILSTTRWNLHPFLALLFAGIGFGLLSRMPPVDVVLAINEGFGQTIGHIGIVIIAGTIIGTFLERSGGAFSMAERILKWIGQRQVPTAMACTGWIVSIPVFADSGFVILSPLNGAVSKRAKISLAGSAIALALGLTASHGLVPPTPGPIAAAGLLGADLGLVMMLGIPISFIALTVGWLFATRVASRVYIDPNPELSEDQVAERLRQAPSAFKAVLPILIPIILIVAKSVCDFKQETSPEMADALWFQCVAFLGEPVIALLVGVLLAFLLPRKFDAAMLSGTGWVGQGLLNAAIIIMITGAGGAFGNVLRNSDIADVIGDVISKANLGIWLPFLIAAAIKTSQGSSTVAIITTATILKPLMSSMGFESPMAIALVVMAIGSGGMVVSHANDSFFWVVTQMSGMDVKTGYRLHTIGTLILGTTAALVVWILSLILL